MYRLDLSYEPPVMHTTVFTGNDTSTVTASSVGMNTIFTVVVGIMLFACIISVGVIALTKKNKSNVA